MLQEGVEHTVPQEWQLSGSGGDRPLLADSRHSPRHTQSLPAMAERLSKSHSPGFGVFRFGRLRSDFFFTPTAATWSESEP